MNVAMAGTSNTLPPEIASKLADFARELREHIYGEQACPKWGTRFTQIEDRGMQGRAGTGSPFHAAVDPASGRW